MRSTAKTGLCRNRGGALLVAAGPDYASQPSIWRTPVDVILPAEPNGRTTDIPFRAQLTDLGGLAFFTLLVDDCRDTIRHPRSSRASRD